MEIDVVADAGSVLYGSFVPFKVADRLAQHDLELTKPALLLASHVTLRTGIFSLASQMQSLRTRLIMPLPSCMIAVRWSAHEAGRAEVLTLGSVDEDDLLPIDEARRLETILDSASDPREFITAISELDEDVAMRIDQLCGALSRDLARRQATLISPDLRRAETAGVLTIRAHTKEPPPLGAETIGEGLANEIDIDKYHDQAIEDLLELLADPSVLPLLDPWARGLAKSSGVLPSREPLRSVPELGAAVLRRLPSLNNASVADILDLREELAGPLARFRGAMVQAADEFVEVPDRDIDRFIEHVTVRDIDPALVDIEDEVRGNSYISELVRVATSPRDMVVSAGSLFVAAGSTASPIQVAAAAVAVGVPFAKAAVEYRDRLRESSKNRFFLLHRLRQIPADY